MSIDTTLTIDKIFKNFKNIRSSVSKTSVRGRLGRVGPWNRNVLVAPPHKRSEKDNCSPKTTSQYPQFDLFDIHENSAKSK